jgi:hypothetical protein
MEYPLWKQLAWFFGIGFVLWAGLHMLGAQPRGDCDLNTHTGNLECIDDQ